MSAFLLDDHHLNALVFWADCYGLIGKSQRDPATCAAAGKMLLRQNVDSLIARYGDDPCDFAEVLASYEYRVTSLLPMLKPVYLLKLCDCYDYQACETEDYDESAAARFVNRLRKYAIMNLPGYDQALWDLKDVDTLRSYADV